MSDEIDYTTEVWKTIPEAPGYFVSSLGRVRGMRTGGILRPGKNRCGYLGVVLSIGGQPVQRRVHRLVGLAFLDPDPNRREVNHKNGVKTDNRAMNLEWATRSENVKHGYEVLKCHDQSGSKNGMARLSEEDVREIKHMLPRWNDAQIAACFNVGRATIWKIRTGRSWTHVAYKGEG